MKKTIVITFIVLVTYSCSDNAIKNKGFQISQISKDESGRKVVGLPIDSLNLETRPRSVLLTKKPSHRLSPIYKVNYNQKTGEKFSGSNSFYRTWDYDEIDGNNWNNNFMPGFTAVYGYNLVNVSHYNNKLKIQNEFFNSPVLIKTLYYPANTNDTINYKPIVRNYYMVSVYDEDTNKDGFINVKDLRRLYHFNINGILQKELVPKNYSVMSSEYDIKNDYMYVFAKIDKNKNGQMEQEEQTHIFWIDLKNPNNTGIQYYKE